MSKYTKGPWRYERDADDGKYVPHAYVWGPSVHIGTSGNLDHTEPDMLLIAAAPEMFEALVAVVTVADRKTDEFDRARAAIAKAMGEV